MRLTADLKTLDKTSYLNDTYCIYRCHYSGLDLPWGGEETKQIHKQAGRKKRRQFIPNQKRSVEKEIDRFIHQTYKIHF